jgi:hypothetical protein
MNFLKKYLLVKRSEYEHIKRLAINWGGIYFPWCMYKNEYEAIPNRCPKCRKKIVEGSYWLKCVGTGIGIITLIKHACGHEMDITNYDCW